MLVVARKGGTQSLGATELQADVCVATSPHLRVNRPVVRSVVRVHVHVIIDEGGL